MMNAKKSGPALIIHRSSFSLLEQLRTSNTLASPLRPWRDWRAIRTASPWLRQRA